MEDSFIFLTALPAVTGLAQALVLNYTTRDFMDIQVEGNLVPLNCLACGWVS